jgi:hypothetical protein
MIENENSVKKIQKSPRKFKKIKKMTTYFLFVTCFRTSGTNFAIHKELEAGFLFGLHSENMDGFF